jgi:hypothetical protein
MKTAQLLHESIGRVVALCDLPDVTICVCGRDFYINQAILPFISNELDEYFAEYDAPFIISLTSDDQSNSLFESVTPSSLIESCFTFLSLIGSETYFRVDQNENLNDSNNKNNNFGSLHIPSLILFAQKIFCNDLLSSIVHFSSSQNQPYSLTFEPSNFVFDSHSAFLEEDEATDNDFSFKVCSKVYKCSSIAAAILSKRAFNYLKNENHHSLEIECPEHLERSRFEETFESVFKILFGFPLSVSNENFEMLLSISSQIENSFIFNSVVEFIQSKDISNIETLLIILQCSEFISEQFDIDSIVSKVSANFSNLSFDALSTLSPSTLSKILKNNNLHLESEDSLFDFLLKYFSVWNEYSLSLFENIYFEYLNETNLETFFKVFSESKFHFPPSIIQSLSFLFKSESRTVLKNRHLSKQIPDTIFSLSQLKNENRCLQNEVAKLKGENINLICQTQTLQTDKQSFENELSKVKSESSSLLSQNEQLKSENQKINSMLSSPSIELFKSLRQKCNNQNPHKSGLVNLSASSIIDSNCDSFNIFEYSRANSWNSYYPEYQWLLFDLREISFKIEKIRFDVYNGHIPRHWRLLGSKDHQNWIQIHEQGNDPRCIPSTDFVVDYDIRTNDYFTLFKFEQLDETYINYSQCIFYSVEFIGRLNSK